MEYKCPVLFPRLAGKRTWISCSVVSTHPRLRLMASRHERRQLRLKLTRCDSTVVSAQNKQVILGPTCAQYRLSMCLFELAAKAFQKEGNWGRLMQGPEAAPADQPAPAWLDTVLSVALATAKISRCLRSAGEQWSRLRARPSLLRIGGGGGGKALRIGCFSRIWWLIITSPFILVLGFWSSGLLTSGNGPFLADQASEAEYRIAQPWAILVCPTVDGQQMIV